MANKPDPDKLKGPGGLSMRELHEQVKASRARDLQSAKSANKLAQPQSRWQRFARYVWDKNRGKG